MSRDRDYYQLVTDRVVVLNTRFRAGQKLVTLEGVYARHQVRPAQWADFRALAEDAADEIPGVRGIGAKTVTPERVLSELGRHDVLHCSCHGAADFAQPTRSGLLLADDQLLTVDDIRRHGGSTLRLAMLSACETAAIGTSMPDEAVGLPSGLLYAGAAGVIGSLWAVPDAATSSLIAQSRHPTPRQVQHWHQRLDAAARLAPGRPARAGRPATRHSATNPAGNTRASGKTSNHFGEFILARRGRAVD